MSTKPRIILPTDFYHVYNRGAHRHDIFVDEDDFAWQSNYYEHIVRDEQSLFNIREYIKNNPANWDNDRNNVS